MYYLGLTSSQYYFLRCHSAIDSLNFWIFFLSFISRIFLHFYFYFNALFLQWSDYHNYHCFLHTLMNQKWHTYLVEISTYVMNETEFFLGYMTHDVLFHEFEDCVNLTLVLHGWWEQLLELLLFHLYSMYIVQGVKNGLVTF